jgi:TonB family protein
MHPAVSQSALALVLVASYLSRPASIDLNQKPIKASLVRLGKPRDPNLLPRKEELPPPPPPKAEEPPPPPPAAKPPEPPSVAIPVPGVKPTPPVAHPRQTGPSEADRRKQLFGAFSKTAKAARPEELEGQADGDAQGDAAEAEGERYWGILSAQVRRNYDVSQTIPESERLHLKARVLIRIGRMGQLIETRLAQPSGNDLFDEAVLSAVKKASPFSPPPDPLRSSLQRTGVVLEFTP